MRAPQLRWKQRVRDSGLNDWALKQRIDCWKQNAITLTGSHCPVLDLAPFNAVPVYVRAFVCVCVCALVCFLYYSDT